MSVDPANQADNAIVDKSALLAELENLKDDSEPPAPVTESEQKSAEEPAETESTEESVETESAEETAAETEEEVTAPKVDPQTAKRLETIRRAEQRAKDAHQIRLLELQRKETELAQLSETVARFEKLKSRVKYDPVAVLQELGVTADDHEYVAKQFFQRSKKALEKPEMREQADREMRSREHEDKLAAYARRVEELEQNLANEKHEKEREKVRSNYLGTVTKVVADDAPIVKNMLSKNPEKTKEFLYTVAEHMAAVNGEIPDPKEVVAQAEQWRRTELEEAGIDLSLITKPKNATPNAGEKRTAKTLSNDLGTPTPVKSAATRTPEEERADVLRAMMSGQLD